jgi:hypothetical protein
MLLAKRSRFNLVKEKIMSATTLHMSPTPVELGHNLPSEETVAAVANHFKAVALFLVAPFIGLLYAVLLPFVGIAMMAKVAYQAARA